MELQHYQQGTEIFTRNQKCDKLIFIVNGIAEIAVNDKIGDRYVMEQL